MSASDKAYDFAGREVLTPRHWGNCLLFALVTIWQRGGRLKLRFDDWAPHVVVEASDGIYEFVYGLHRPLSPIFFKGYGVRSPK